MIPLAELSALAQQALLLSAAIALPVVGAAAVVGLIVAALQAATQLQDNTLGHLPRFLVVVVVLALTAPRMGAEIAEFAARAFVGG